MLGLNPVEQILQLRIRKRVVIRLRGSVPRKKRRSAAQIGKVEAEWGDLIWYNCRQWAAPATELPPCHRRDSIPSHQRCSAQRGPSRTGAPRRAQLLSLPRDYVLFALFTSLSRPTVPNCDLILFFCLLLAGISDFNYGPWLSSSRCGRDRVYCWS